MRTEAVSKPYYDAFQLRPGIRIAFPDFVLIYHGAHSQELDPSFAPVGSIHEFTVFGPLLFKRMTWSSGFGFRAPLEFNVLGREFVLSPDPPPGELGQSPSKETWYCYPASPDHNRILSQPSLFILDVNERQEAASKDPVHFGKLVLKPSGWTHFKVSSLQWHDGVVVESNAVEFDLVKSELFLPPGVYSLKGYGKELVKKDGDTQVFQEKMSKASYFEIEAQKSTQIEIMNYPETFPSDPTETRTGELNESVIIGDKWLTEFPAGFTLRIKRIEDKLLAKKIWFSYGPSVYDSAVAIISNDRFDTDNSNRFPTAKFYFNQAQYEVRVEHIVGVGAVRAKVTHLSRPNDVMNPNDLPEPPKLPGD